MRSCVQNFQAFSNFFEFHSSPSEEFTDSWRAESLLTLELEPLQLFTVPPSSSISLLKFSSSQVTLPRILRLRESHQDTCFLPSEVMRSSIPWSRLPLPVVVSSPTSTKLSSWSSPRRSERHETQLMMLSLDNEVSPWGKSLLSPVHAPSFPHDLHMLY